MPHNVKVRVHSEESTDSAGDTKERGRAAEIQIDDSSINDDTAVVLLQGLTDDSVILENAEYNDQDLQYNLDNEVGAATAGRSSRVSMLTGAGMASKKYMMQETDKESNNR